MSLSDLQTKIESGTPLTVSETAEALGVNYFTVYRAVRRGDLPASRIGKRVLIPVGPVQAIREGRLHIN